MLIDSLLTPIVESTYVNISAHLILFLMISEIFPISAISCSLVIRWGLQHKILAVEVKNSAKVVLVSFNAAAVFPYDVMVSENDIL